MLLFPHLTKEQIAGSFQFKGIAFFCIPIYGSTLADEPDVFTIVTRNWIPLWTAAFAGLVFNLLFAGTRFAKYGIIKTKNLPQSYVSFNDSGAEICICPSCTQEREEQNQGDDNANH